MSALYVGLICRPHIYMSALYVTGADDDASPLTAKLQATLALMRVRNAEQWSAADLVAALDSDAGMIYGCMYGYV